MEEQIDLTDFQKKILNKIFSIEPDTYFELKALFTSEDEKKEWKKNHPTTIGRKFRKIVDKHCEKCKSKYKFEVYTKGEDLMKVNCLDAETGERKPMDLKFQGQNSQQNHVYYYKLP
jgi:hypothetical protein